MTRVYYKEAVGAFIVFDVTRASTFEAVQKWKNDLDAKVALSDGSPIPCVLLANKVRTLFLIVHVISLTLSFDLTVQSYMYMDLIRSNGNDNKIVS